VLEDGVVVGLIFFLDAVGPQDRPLDVGEQSQRRHTPRRARLRADARGRDGGVREESVQGVKGVGRPSDASIQNNSGLPQGLMRAIGADCIPSATPSSSCTLISVCLQRAQ